MNYSSSYSSSSSSFYEVGTPTLIGLFIISYLVSILSVLGGISGGAMIIPLFSLLLDRDVKDLVFFSLVIICGGAIVRAGYFLKKRHNLAENRYLTNYELTRLTIIFTSSTSFLGYALNRVLPNIVILILIVITMSVLIFTTIKNTIKVYKQKDNNIVDKDNILIDGISLDSLDNNKDKLPENNSSKSNETKFYLFKNIVFTLLITGLGFFFTFVRNIYDEFSLEAWLIYINQFVISMIFAFQIINEIKMQHILRKKTKFTFVEGDIEWDDNKNFLKYGILSSFVGFIASLIGIGGSIIMNPIMINLKLLPEVVVATSAVTSFFASFLSTIQYIFDEELDWILLGLFLSGSIGTLTGIIIYRFLNKNKNIRIIIMSFLIISLIGSLILLLVTNIISIVKNGI